jgi:hypothetical protein
MDRSNRTYRHLSALVLGGVGAATATALSLGNAPGAGAAAIFGADPLPDDSTVALAQPVDGSRWNLVVVRRLQGSTGCWQRLSDGLVQLDTEALSNDAVCNRLQSSSGYSLRTAGQDLRSPWRLRIERQGQQLALQAFNPSQGQSIVVGLAPVPEGAGGSVLPAFTLSAGWSVQARSFEGRQLSHLYLSNQEPIAALVARSTRPGTLPPLTARREPVSREAAAPLPDQVIALQVVPYRGDSDLNAANP